MLSHLIICPDQSTAFGPPSVVVGYTTFSCSYNIVHVSTYTRTQPPRNHTSVCIKRNTVLKVLVFIEYGTVVAR